MLKNSSIRYGSGGGITHITSDVSAAQVRLKVLKQAEVLLFKYLDDCERLQLFDEADREAWQAMLKDGERSTSGDRRPFNREQKIERFRCAGDLQRLVLPAIDSHLNS